MAWAMRARASCGSARSKLLIAIPEQDQLAHAEHGRRGPKLRLADAGERCRAGVQLVSRQDAPDTVRADRAWR